MKDKVTREKKSHRLVKIGWIFLSLSLVTSYFLPSALRYFDAWGYSFLWIIIVGIPGLLLIATIVISVSALIGASRSKGVYKAQSMWAVILLIFPLTFLALTVPSLHPSSATQARIKADLQKIEALQEVYRTNHPDYAVDKAALTAVVSTFPESPTGDITYETYTDRSCAEETAGGAGALTDMGLDDGDGDATDYCITRQ